GAWSEVRRSRRGAWVLAGFYALLSVGLPVAGTSLRTTLGDPGMRALQLLSIGFAVLAVLTAWLGRTRPALGWVPSLAFTPMVLLLAHPALLERARAESGAPLAAAIAAADPAARVRYEFCYSPGTDFLLGRTSALVSPLGMESTSNYQVRYRKLLIERGAWKAAAATVDRVPASVIVRPARDSRPPP